MQENEKLKADKDKSKENKEQPSKVAASIEQNNDTELKNLNENDNEANVKIYKRLDSKDNEQQEENKSSV